MKNDPIQNALARLDEVETGTPAGKKQLVAALAAKSNFVVARAARIIGVAQCLDLTPELAAAFARLLARGSDADKGCVALNAIARALIQLEYDGAELFLQGMRHVQMEGSWGPPVDAASELRAVCAMGLAGSTYPSKLREMLPLLVDREWQARAGAVRAVTALGSEAASLLLRFKALAGDAEPEVLADCFEGLLAVEGGEAVPLVGTFAEKGPDEVREAALLALGASRRADAVEWLKERFDRTMKIPERKCILLSLASSRTEAGVEFLIGVVRDGSAQISEAALAALEMNGALLQGDERVRAAVEAALVARAGSRSRE